MTDSLRLNLPYLMGVYIALNAVRDAYLLVDGPQCVTFKAEHVAGKHDWRSSLLDCEGFHRIALSGTTFNSIAFSREEKISRLLRRLAERPDAGVVMISCLTMCGLTGIQYDRITRPLARETGKPFLEILCDSLDKDWLDGYAAVWEGVARSIELKSARRKKNSIVLVGHLMDRNEGDQTGNLEEMTRMLGALSLDVAAAWPSGGAYGDLAKAAEASAVISLPYAREAGKVLAERLKVPLIETGLPFGLEASARWMNTVARALGRSKAAGKFIRAQTRAAAAALEWTVPQVFLNRKFLYLGDPFLFEGFCEIASGLGARVEAAAVISRRGRLAAMSRALKNPALEEPGEAKWLEAAQERGPFDLCVSNNLGWQVLGQRSGPVMEFGFPSLFHHCLAARPFLGFKGFLHFTDRMAEHVMEARMREKSERRVSPPASGG